MLDQSAPWFHVVPGPVKLTVAADAEKVPKASALVIDAASGRIAEPADFRRRCEERRIRGLPWEEETEEDCIDARLSSRRSTSPVSSKLMMSLALTAGASWHSPPLLLLQIRASACSQPGRCIFT